VTARSILPMDAASALNASAPPATAESYPPLGLHVEPPDPHPPLAFPLGTPGSGLVLKLDHRYLFLPRR
jgi:hypothetical protein